MNYLNYQPKQNMIFGDASLLDFGAFAFYCNTLDTPTRSRTTVNVPGRNGALIFDNGRYDDITRTYMVQVDSYRQALNLAAKLKSINGYAKLSDGYDPEVIMEARLDTVAGPRISGGAVEMQITFTRKPQKFLAQGQEGIIFTASGKIYNPTPYASNPLIRVYGSGVLGIGGESITIDSDSAYIDIDCEIQNAYYLDANKNDRITLTSGQFFSFQPGVNNISIGNGITKIIVTPKWWTL